MRLDVYLTTVGVESRNKASALIENGLVAVDGCIVTKQSFDVKDGMRVVFDQTQKYVSRSAHKLKTAFEVFPFDVTGKTGVDLGSSTGGFCQVLLEQGASHVYAVDIGTAQLHPSLRSDDRITVMENTNARYIAASDFPETIGFVTGDLSFISLKLILEAVKNTLESGGYAVLLVKPQFEVGNANVGKRGVVKDKKLHIKAIKGVSEYAALLGFSVLGVHFSGLEGESGNREYLLFLRLDGEGKTVTDKEIESCVSEETP